MSSTPLNRPLRLVDTPEAARAFADEFLPDIEGRTIGLDVEEDRMVHYAPRIALLQVTIDEVDVLLDPLRLEHEVLSPIVEALCIRAGAILMHGAQNDVTGLKRDFGVGPDALRDTQIAARFAGQTRFGLAGLLESEFGISLDKEQRMSDWTARPLSNDQIRYARRDTVWLADLWERLEEGVRARGFEDAVAEENEALAELPVNDPGFDPSGWRSQKGLRGQRLEPLMERRAAALWALRDEVARTHDRHPTRTLPPWLLAELVRRGPRMMDGQRRNKALRAFVGLVGDDALRQLLTDPPPFEAGDVPERRGGRGRPPWHRSPHFDRRVQALLAWRDEEAERTGIEAGFLAPRALLEQLAEVDAPEHDVLAAIPDVRRWRLRRYADAWLGLLRT
ncbi:MAG: hypothetical protein EA398_00330 [Deltaproteobacteria bacterium]|nr:MAG: hypothetical protein EA398_00330 [Deltaproteobacteria bacterium]